MRKWVCISAGLFLGAFLCLGADSSPEKLMEGGHWKRLRALEDRRVSANSNDAEAAYYLGKAKEEFGDLQGAMALAEKAVSLNSNNARYHLFVAEVAIDMGQKAGILKGLGMAHRFRQEAEKAVSLDPRYIDAHEDLMEFYQDAPGIAGGDKKKARAAAEEIMRIDTARGWLAQATLASKEKNAAKQEECYQKALATAPQDGRVLREMAAYYSSEAQKKYGLAEKYALEALKISEDHAVPYVALAVTYAAAERWKDLDALMERAEKNIPDDFGAH
ncbi:MAG TPA: hypothetical protein VGF20_03170 [Candidatus Acidoferrum sp.]